MTRTRRLPLVAASLAAAAAVTFGAAQAASAQPVITGGLVNVVVANNAILNNVSVGAALGVAANVCGVAVNVLAQQLPSAPTCTSTTGQTVSIVPA